MEAKTRRQLPRALLPHRAFWTPSPVGHDGAGRNCETDSYPIGIIYREQLELDSSHARVGFGIVYLDIVVSRALEYNCVAAEEVRTDVEE